MPVMQAGLPAEEDLVIMVPDDLFSKRRNLLQVFESPDIFRFQGQGIEQLAIIRRIPIGIGHQRPHPLRLPPEDPVGAPRKHLADGPVPFCDMGMEQEVRNRIDSVHQDKLFQTSHGYQLKQTAAAEFEIGPGDFHQDNHVCPGSEELESILPQCSDAVGPQKDQQGHTW